VISVHPLWIPCPDKRGSLRPCCPRETDSCHPSPLFPLNVFSPSDLFKQRPVNRDGETNGTFYTLMFLVLNESPDLRAVLEARASCGCCPLSYYWWDRLARCFPFFFFCCGSFRGPPRAVLVGFFFCSFFLGSWSTPTFQGFRCGGIFAISLFATIRPFQASPGPG